MGEALLVGLAILGLYLATRRWFWILVFGLATLASGFTVVASVIHFQILAAVGFTVLTALLWTITSALAEGA